MFELRSNMGWSDEGRAEGAKLEVGEVRLSSIIMYMTSVNARKRQATDA